jgi:glutamate--cysteine ligase
MDIRTSVEALFAAGSGTHRVGLEIELFPVHAGAGHDPVAPESMSRFFDREFVAAARPTFEPGGQLEVSPPPRDSVDEAVRDARRLIAGVSASARAAGISLVSEGTDPWHSCADIPLRTPTPRYRAMQTLFDAVGEDGRRMMRLTASLQICVDLLPGSAGREQWLVANLAGPALASAFANSPTLDGRPAGIPGVRTGIWMGVDMRRTGYDGRHLDVADPIGAYAAFANAAERLPIAEASDACYHLTTLFPPVRPRGGYLEIRYIDAQPLAQIPEVVSTVATLMYEPRVRSEALAVLLPGLESIESWWRAAALGRAPHQSSILALATGFPERGASSPSLAREPVSPL